MKTKLRFNNTYNSGVMTILIFKRGSVYRGVCLEFDLEVEEKTAKQAEEQIFDYAKLWLENAVKNKLPEEVLNRPAPKEYWRIYKELVDQDLKKLEAEKGSTQQIKSRPQEVLRFQTYYPNLAFA